MRENNQRKMMREYEGREIKKEREERENHERRIKIITQYNLYNKLIFWCIN